MEQKENKVDKSNNETDHNGTNGLTKQIESLTITLEQNLTSLDLSSKNIQSLIENVKLPPNLMQLNLSHNHLTNVPNAVLELENLKIFILSFNSIQYFDDKPKFCHNLEILDISNNSLKRPPYWVWTENPQNLRKMNLSNNRNITDSFRDGKFKELLTYSTHVTEVYLEDCTLSNFTEILGTFPRAKTLHLATDINSYKVNMLLELPCKGLDKCCDLERLNVCNTYIFTINPSIEMYKNLVEINLAYNSINGLPKEFCYLENLEICILSVNKLLYLPDEMQNLHKLVRLYLNSNDLCMIPEFLCELPSLKTLDLYDNHLNDIPENYKNLEEVDLAYNYFDEPEDINYSEKKEKLRLMHENRCDGRKMVIEKSDYDESHGTTSEDDDELYEILHRNKENEVSEPLNLPDPPPSSPEDWDSDAYWEPANQCVLRSKQTPWLHYVRKKMEEGNFCPMDAHVVSVAERVRYEKLCNPQLEYESEGQFDDCSCDET